MIFLYSEFGLIFFYLVCSVFLSFVIFAAAYFFSITFSYTEKLFPYECGFDPFDDARNQFEIRFYIIAILFLIFDLEASFLFPWAVVLDSLGSFGFWVIIDFFFELVIGFFYVWQIGSFNWS